MRPLDYSLKIIFENPDHFLVKGFCTHLAGPESISNYRRIQRQLKKYNSMYKMLEQYNIIPKYRHVTNSAGAFVYPKARFNMARIGIMLYGFWSSAEIFIHYVKNRKEKTDPLDRILSWKSRIMSVKTIAEGEFVGYGVSWLAQKETRTALIPVGYSVGYSRSLSNKGTVIIRGQICNVIGIVNMNMIIADITDLPGAGVNDEVVIIGKQGDQEIKVSAFSDISNSLNYEVLAHLSPQIRRITK